MIDQTAQRTMQPPGQGLIPQGRPTIDFKEYPKMMTHPAYQPGKPGPEVKSPHGFTYHIGGEPIRYPPVLVKTPDDEEYHKSMGYESQGKCDAAAFARAVGAGQIPDHVDYKPLEYPKWVQGKLVHSREEENKLSQVVAIFAPSENEATRPDLPVLLAPSVEETTEEKRARLLKELAELDGFTVDGAATNRLAVDEFTERSIVKAAPKKKAAKKPRKIPVLSEAQRKTRSEAIRAGLARKRALTESVAVDDVPESQR